MKKAITFLLCLALISIIISPFRILVNAASADSYTTNHRSKAIHVIYDDSGSMIRDGGVYLDRWGQAKYAMEVFAAMLEEKDTMRVYYMSDFDMSVKGSDINAPPRVTISGSEPAASRVSKIHNEITQSANTPFDPVLKAYADIKNETVDEKWLVVLTDGAFNRLYGKEVSSVDVDVDGFYSQFVTESNVKIIHFAMGDDAATITPDPDRNIFFEQSRNNNEILGKITNISNQIFNRNVLRFSNEDNREFSFDIPMMELLIFAQGGNVNIDGITSGGSTYKQDETVGVRYSETAATNYVNDSNVIVSYNLVGVIATVKDIPKGVYKLNISEADTVEIYYKPVVELDIKLFQNGVEIRDNPVTEGAYEIYYGIVNESGEFFQSNLLGFVSYTAVAQNGSNEIHITNGQTINLAPEELIVDVKAQFLEINTAEAKLSRRVGKEPIPTVTPTPTIPPPSLGIEITAPNDDFTRSNLDDSGAFVITAKYEGSLLAEEQWRSMDLPTVTANANVDITDIRHGSTVSTFEFNIRQKNGDRFQTAHGTVTIDAKAKLVYDINNGNICEGNGNILVKIRNDISWKDIIGRWVKLNWGWLKWVLGVLTLLLLIYLLWGRKKRFPNAMKRRPVIIIEDNTGTTQDTGSFKKNPKSVWMPFCPESGTLTAFTGDSPHLSFKVKALGRRQMQIVRIEQFAGDDNFSINGLPIPEGATGPRNVSCFTRFISTYRNIMGNTVTETSSFNN